MSDIYSFVVIMLLLLSGHKPFSTKLTIMWTYFCRLQAHIWAIFALRGYSSGIDTLPKMLDSALEGLYPAKSFPRLTNVIVCVLSAGKGVKLKKCCCIHNPVSAADCIIPISDLVVLGGLSSIHQCKAVRALVQRVQRAVMSKGIVFNEQVAYLKRDNTRCIFKPMVVLLF